MTKTRKPTNRHDVPLTVDPARPTGGSRKRPSTRLFSIAGPLCLLVLTLTACKHHADPHPPIVIVPSASVPASTR